MDNETQPQSHGALTHTVVQDTVQSGPGQGVLGAQKREG